ncbi:endonuclease/exonuclease/phosphatase family protein [Actinophytocola glycyrrhizae]|uniref:Endonuclease/exonuclease/phosphatase family protein n=1 Tax=Actinophytocola glycyrrhizae TaxID=2044873 RepID=A0ABV9SC44_9PSEU
MRVVTRNVRHEAGDPRRTALLNRELRGLAPDLVALQEVRHPEQLTRLLARTRLRHVTHQADVLRVQPPEAEHFGGTAIATREPHRVVDVVERRVGEFHYWTLAVRVGGLLFVVPTTPWQPAAAEVRHLQAQEVLLRYGGMLPLIVAGDLNAPPDEAGIRHLGAHLQDAWTVAGAGPGLTWSADNPLAAAEIARLDGTPGRIDYVFAGPDFLVTAARLVGERPVDGVWLSDHAGVVADLTAPG